ncbi:hypothetical protein OAD61_00200 [bacterium]|nr:hypothetical protein [bacterium]
MGVVIRVIETGKVFDTTGVSITYTKQASDLGDITKANSSYSWGFKMPKTKNNTSILRGLGLIGDVSRIPYETYHCQIVDNGIEIVSYGLLKIQSTGDDYKAFVQEGIVEFYDLIKTDTISQAIPEFLDSLLHEATISTIIASQVNEFYRYVVADYNYTPADQTGTTTIIPKNSMIPSINLFHLFDQIMLSYGWTYNGLPDITNQWLTYPITKAAIDPAPTIILDAVYDTPQVQSKDIGSTQTLFPWPNRTLLFDAGFIDEIANNEFRVLVGGSYRVQIQVSGYFTFFTQEGAEQVPINLRLYQNGVQIANDSSANNAIQTFQVNLFQDATLEVFTLIPNQFDSDVYMRIEQPTQIRIEKLNVTEIDFNAAFINYKVKDFFKEVLLRTAVTSYADAQIKHIEFKTLDQRLASTPINWTSKYVSRLNESYVYKSYARENYYRHKYNDGDEQDYADGILVVDNENLAVEKTLYTSKIYAPSLSVQEYKNPSNTYQVRNYQMWQGEPKEIDDPNNAGEKITVIEYKELKGRFYILQTGEQNFGGVYIENEQNLMGVFTPAVIQGGVFKTIIGEDYQLVRDVLNDTRIHTIELLLSKSDIMSLDLSAKYYFEKEHQVYLLNKLTWTEGKTTIGEFIRINF